MIGNNIKRLRTERHMTQKELADQLYVTAQAVSRWEKGDVEPSLRTVAELAKIFQVSTDEILGVSSFEEEDHSEGSAHSSQQNFQKEKPQILAFCEECDRPIYELDEMVRVHNRLNGERYTICRECDLRRKKLAKEEKEKENTKARKKAKWARIKSIVFGSLLLIFFLYAAINSIVRHDALSNIGNYLGGAAVWLVLMYIAFSFLSCIWLRNSFFGRMLRKITFSIFDFFDELLDFDDFIFMIIFGPIYLVAIVIGAAIALIVGCCVAPFLFPFSLRKNLKHPEKTLVKGFWVSPDDF